MRQVVATGRPLLLDIMRFGSRQFVVTRLPLTDDAGKVSGAVGFALYDRLDHLKPIITKFERLQSELARARQELAMARRTRYSLSQFIGSSPEVLEVKRQARRCAGGASPVLILGETGTGKELLAQSIHAASARAAHPFVAINVAAVPDTLLEAEFFGVAPGAFTGAERRPREGKFKLADGGTLFLDEVGDMPFTLQAKLLRVLQEQEIEPLGSNRLVKIDVRVIAATSHDLARKVAEGSFRADLFYRLNVVPIRIPPVRERLGDLPALCDALLAKVAARSGTMQRELAPESLDLLARHDWPGNVRELANLLERGCLLTDAPELGTAELEPLLPPAIVATPERSAGASPRLADRLAETERAAIASALETTGGNRAAAARLLGISRSQLYEKLAAHGLSA